MTSLPPLDVSRFVATWRLDWWAAAALLALATGYLFGLVRLRRRGRRWPAYRMAAYFLLGIAPGVIVTMSSIAVYARVLLWPAAVQVVVLLTIVPVGLGLGDPLGLVTAVLPDSMSQHWQRWLRSRPVRALTFPVVAPLLALGTQLLIFFSGYLGEAERHGTVLHLLELQLVLTGCLFALPLLGVEILPSWCTQPVRMAFAAIDGLLDAVPGIAVMTSKGLVAAGYYGSVSRSWGPSRLWDQAIGGGLMLTIAEVVAVPFAAMLFRAWIREDETNARMVDRELDAADAVAVTSYDEEPLPTRPWWELDPGPLADRAERYGWTSGSGPST